MSLCLLCSAGILFTIQPLTCLGSQMPSAYKMLYFFVFSEVLLFLCLAKQLLCAALVRFGGEGCFNGVRGPGPGFQRVKASSLPSPATGAADLHEKRQNYPFSASASVRICKCLWLSVYECTKPYQIETMTSCPVLTWIAGHGHILPELDSRKNYQEPGPGKMGTGAGTRRVQTAKGGPALLWHLSHHPRGFLCSQNQSCAV